MHDKFTERVRKVIYLAREEAARLQHDYIGTEHLLLGVIREGEGIAATVLNNLGLDLDRIRQEVENMVSASGGTMTIGEIPFTPRAKRVLELAVEEARSLGHNYVGTEHLLLGLVREGEGVAAKVLLELGVDRKRVREETLKLLGGTPGRGIRDEVETPALDSFGHDLTRLGRLGQLDPPVGCERTIERVIGILSKREVKNPLLIGPAGLMRQFILEGLALRIASGQVPSSLTYRRLVLLDLDGVIAGSQTQGQVADRLKTVVEEIRAAGNIILFLDQLRRLVSPEYPNEGMDGSMTLKRGLALGEVQCIGAATAEEHHRYIESDPAFGRRFQPVSLDPPSPADTTEIVKVIRSKLEAHHGAKITDEAVLAAVELSDQYLGDRWFPDKAIDVIDEACARAQLSAGGAATSGGRREIEVDRESIVRAVAGLADVEVERVSRREAPVAPPKPKSRLALGYERRMVQAVLPRFGSRIRRSTGFVLLPHTAEFDAIYDDVIRPILNECGIVAKKADDI